VQPTVAQQFRRRITLVSQQLKREIVIEAPPEIVWGAVTEPDQIALWFSDAAEFDLQPGGAGSLTWHPGGNATDELSKTLVVPVQVLEVDPPRYFSFRWTHPEGVEATEENSLLVEFTLSPEGETTRLSVVESGFQEIDRDAEAEMEGHGEGWAAHLEGLREYVTRNATQR
jgi:uncharacterized protein YndB with AHSA1/START domain